MFPQVYEERDEINLAGLISRLNAEFAGSFVQVHPHKRPIELVELIDDEIDHFHHLDGVVISADVGTTTQLVEGDDIFYVRHFRPYAPDAVLKSDDVGGLEENDRVVPVFLFSKDLRLDDLVVGRYVVGMTKPNSCGHCSLFYEQVLVLSFCGNGETRANLTFSGERIPSNGFSLCGDDILLVQSVFSLLKRAYGTDGFEFLGREVNSNKYYLGRSAGFDVGYDVAFNDYILRFGNYLREQLAVHKERIISAAEHC